MAEIDPLIARILLKGDDEFLNSLKKVGEEGAENFEHLFSAIEKGASSAEALTSSLGLIVAALSGATAATTLFIEEQTELTQKTILLSDAFGTTAGELQGLEATFASAGVKVDQFERFANRLTVTIARQWPQIAESIKTYASQSDSAQLRVSTSILAVREAQNALADNSEDRAAKIAKNNNDLEASYQKLQFAAAHAASEQVGALQAVRGAELSVEAAQQRLATLEGRPPSAAEKQNLEIAQAQQAVDTARRAEADARIAQQEKAAGAALKQAQLEQAYSDLQRKAAKDARDDADQREKDENRVKAAVIARGEAEERVNKLALTSVVSIRSALDGLVTGNKAAAAAIDLTEVSVQNLIRGLIAQAAETSKATQPTGYEVLRQLTRTLASDTDHLISTEQRLALVNRLAAASMRTLGASAAEILHVLENDREEIEKLNEAASEFDTKEARRAIEDFRGALAGLNLTISILSQRFALAVSPAFTAFLLAIKGSIESSNGVIHTFLAGLAEIGRILAQVADGANNLITIFARWIGLKDSSQVWVAIFVALGVAVAATATALLAWPAIIAAIVVVIGYIADNWDKVKKGAADAWQAVKDSTVVKFFESVLDVVLKIVKAIGSVASYINKVTAPSDDSAGNSGDAGEAAIPGHAGGGHIKGPGTGTSDSIFARLSDGEFVMRTAAVQNYGVGLFHALNNMQLPGFASGGLVQAPARMGGGSIAPATSTLNLSIDGRSFNGLRGPKSTIDDLSSFAISRQASAAGVNPSWMK